MVRLNTKVFFLSKQQNKKKEAVMLNMPQGLHSLKLNLRNLNSFLINFKYLK